MDPLTMIIMADAAMTFLQKAVPAIRDAFAKGDIPAEQQAEVRRKYEELRAKGGDAFKGPEYDLSGR